MKHEEDEAVCSEAPLSDEQREAITAVVSYLQEHDSEEVAALLNIIKRFAKAWKRLAETLLDDEDNVVDGERESRTDESEG